jgi:hypothetical protein
MNAKVFLGVQMNKIKVQPMVDPETGEEVLINPGSDLCKQFLVHAKESLERKWEYQVPKA